MREAHGQLRGTQEAVVTENEGALAQRRGYQLPVPIVYTRRLQVGVDLECHPLELVGDLKTIKE